LPGVSRLVSVDLAVPAPNPAKNVMSRAISKRPVGHLSRYARRAQDDRAAQRPGRRPDPQHCDDQAV
jgi:hypothetical protein